MSLLDHVKDVAFAASIPTDMILGTFSGSLFASAPSPTTIQKTTTTTSIATGIPEKTFFQGVFSTDNGVTWVDFNSNIVNNTNPSFVGLQTQMMYGKSSIGTLTLSADNWTYYTGSGYTSASYTFLYKVVLFRRPNQGNVTPQPVAQPLNFSARYNYQKIFRDSVFPFDFAIGTTTATITHGLGYIPKVRSYVDNFSFADDIVSLYDFGYFLSQYNTFQLYMDEMTVNYYIDNSSGLSALTGTLYTRIYYDT
jgi:hypothetical protein